MTISETEFCEQLGKECMQVAKDWGRARRDGALRARDEAVKSRDKWRKRWQETQNELSVTLAELNKLKSEQKANTIPAPPPIHVFDWRTDSQSMYYDVCNIGGFSPFAEKEGKPICGDIPVQIYRQGKPIIDLLRIPGKTPRETAEQWYIDNVVNKQG